MWKMGRETGLPKFRARCVFWVGFVRKVGSERPRGGVWGRETYPSTVRFYLQGAWKGQRGGPTQQASCFLPLNSRLLWSLLRA